MIEPSQYAWPGPFQIALPSGDKVTIALYHNPGKSDEPIVVMEDRRQEELSAEDLRHICIISWQVTQAAPGHFLRAIVGPAEMRIEPKPISISSAPDVLRASGFNPMTPATWEIAKSRPWWGGL